MLTFVFPVLSYFKVKENIPLHVKVILCELLLVSIVFGVGSVYSSVIGIVKIYRTNDRHAS